MQRPPLAVCLAVLTLLPSCGPEPAASSEFAEVCGTRGPHRLLAFEPGERIDPFFGKRKIGDRFYFVTGTGESSFLGWTTPATAVVHSTDPCGEDRRFIADDIRDVFEREQLPGVLLGCRGRIDGDLFILDAAGGNPPRLLAADGCSPGGWTDHGIIRVERYDDDLDLARLLFHPFPADLDSGPIAPVVLADSIRSSYVTTLPDIDEVLALDPDGDLLRIALPGGETSVEQSSIARFEATQDGRYLAWMQRPAGDAEEAAGDIVLRDRSTGVDTVLVTEPHSFRHIRFRRVGLELLEVGPYGAGRIVTLPGPAELDIPAGRWLVFDLSESRWLMQGEDGGWYVRDPIAGTETLITADSGTLLGASVGYLDLLRKPDESDPHGELWRYQFDGSEPELLAVRVTEPGWLADRRIYTVVDVDEKGVGELVLVDPEELGERRLDERVVTNSSFFGWETALFEDRDTIVYEVRDGERDGLWIVRPAAAP